MRTTAEKEAIIEGEATPLVHDSLTPQEELVGIQDESGVQEPEPLMPRVERGSISPRETTTPTNKNSHTEEESPTGPETPEEELDSPPVEGHSEEPTTIRNTPQDRIAMEEASVGAEAETLIPTEKRPVGGVLEEADSTMGEPEVRTLDPEVPLETAMVGKGEEEDDTYSWEEDASRVEQQPFPLPDNNPHSPKEDAPRVER